MAPALLHLLSMLRVPGGCRLLSRARRDPLSQLQQQPIERNPHPHTLPYIHLSLFYTAVPSPENFPSQLTPMLILLFENTANYPLTQWSQLHQNTATGKNTG